MFCRTGNSSNTAHRRSCWARDAGSPSWPRSPATRRRSTLPDVQTGHETGQAVYGSRPAILDFEREDEGLVAARDAGWRDAGGDGFQRPLQQAIRGIHFSARGAGRGPILAFHPRVRGAVRGGGTNLLLLLLSAG